MPIAPDRSEPHTAPLEVRFEHSGPPAPKVLQRHESYQFEDQQSYVHAVSLIPLSDSPSPEPFIIDGRGLDQRARMFVFDHAGMRFYMSELNADVFSVSKNGMLLLNKTDSIRMRGIHEQIVNRLRLHGLVLPAEFGTAVLGKDDLSQRVEFRLHALLELVLNLGKTTTWHCVVSVLDEKVQQRMGVEPTAQRTGRHDVERGRHAAPGKRTDVKGLERLLTREKKIAESILNALASVAESHTVEHIVNLGSGRTEDWKAILSAAFSLPPAWQQRFFRTVVELESEHVMIEPMVRITGTTECFSLLM
jgi:hypothetical protein